MMAVTFLFVPAHEARKVDHALAAGADAVIVDLEDGVPEAGKSAARMAAASICARAGMSHAPGAPQFPQLWVRVNGEAPHFHADVQAIPWGSAFGAVLPKAENPSQVAALERAGAERILLLIESVAGLRALPRLVEASSRVQRCAIGLLDFTRDLDLLAIDDPDEAELMWHLRAELVVESRALRLRPPVDAVYVRLDDESGLRRVAERAAKLGFAGKMLVHPKQIPVVAAAFSIGEDRLEAAREIVDAHEQALRDGLGVFRVRGKMVDRPVIEQAKALLERARKRLEHD